MACSIEPADLFEDLASIEIVAMLNEPFCELHHKPYCPASEELSRECGKVRLDTLAGNSFLLVSVLSESCTCSSCSKLCPAALLLWDVEAVR